MEIPTNAPTCAETNDEELSADPFKEFGRCFIEGIVEGTRSVEEGANDGLDIYDDVGILKSVGISTWLMYILYN